MLNLENRFHNCTSHAKFHVLVHSEENLPQYCASNWSTHRVICIVPERALSSLSFTRYRSTVIFGNQHVEIAHMFYRDSLILIIASRAALPFIRIWLELPLSNPRCRRPRWYQARWDEALLAVASLAGAAASLRSTSPRVDASIWNLSIAFSVLAGHFSIESACHMLAKHHLHPATPQSPLKPPCKPSPFGTPPPPLAGAAAAASGPFLGAVVRAVTYRSRQTVMRGCAQLDHQPTSSSHQASPAAAPRRISVANLAGSRRDVMESELPAAFPRAILAHAMRPRFRVESPGPGLGLASCVCICICIHPGAVLLSSFDCNIA
ncbi:hypothetical protein CCMA1212_000320 [Trichoderma ghanense]|uniref:Uncharacterized protein n=1 Tax=Trichoderma ghanense TaxID=65468 RepID=A0ABY2HFX6_9HYPO